MKNKTKRRLGGVFLALLMVVGASAWLYNSDTQTSTNEITVGRIGIQFTDQSHTITLSGNNAIPMTSAYAEANLTPYEYTLENTGDVDLYYKVYLVEDTNTFQDGAVMVKGTYYEMPVEYGVDSPLEVGVLEAGDEVTYDDMILYLNSSVGGSYTEETMTFDTEAEAQAYATSQGRYYQGGGGHDQDVIIHDQDGKYVIYDMTSESYFSTIVSSGSLSDYTGKSATFHLEVEAIQDQTIATIYLTSGRDSVSDPTEVIISTDVEYVVSNNILGPTAGSDYSAYRKVNGEWVDITSQCTLDENMFVIIPDLADGDYIKIIRHLPW